MQEAAVALGVALAAAVLAAKGWRAIRRRRPGKGPDGCGTCGKCG